MHDPGGNNFNIEDGSTCDDGDSISGGSEPHATNTHHSHDRDNIQAIVPNLHHTPPALRFDKENTDGDNNSNSNAADTNTSSDDVKPVYNPGENTLRTKDGSTRDNNSGNNSILDNAASFVIEDTNSGDSNSNLNNNAVIINAACTFNADATVTTNTSISNPNNAAPTLNTNAADTETVSSDNASYIADAHHSCDRDRDKADFTVSNIDPVLEFAQATCHVPGTIANAVIAIIAIVIAIVNAAAINANAVDTTNNSISNRNIVAFANTTVVSTAAIFNANAAANSKRPDAGSSSSGRNNNNATNATFVNASVVSTAPAVNFSRIDGISSINNNANDADSIVTPACALSASKCRNTNTYPRSCIVPNTTAHNIEHKHKRGRTGTSSLSTIVHDNELEHECVRISPRDIIPQAPPLAAPRPDQPKQPPPSPSDGHDASAANTQAVQAYARPIVSDLARAPPDAFARFISIPRRLISPADDFGNDREHQRQVDPGGSNFKPPGRCKERTRPCCTRMHSPSLTLMVVCSFPGHTTLLGTKDK